MNPNSDNIHYDPLLGQFISVDPLADKYPGWGPYVYCMNNPVAYWDPNGEDWYQAVDENNEELVAVIWKEGSEEIEGYKNIGEEYTQTLGDGTEVKYNQNVMVEMTEYVLDDDDYRSQMTGKVIGGKFEKKAGEEGNCYYQAGQMVKQSGATSLVGGDNNKPAGAEGQKYLDSEINKGRSARVQVTTDGSGSHWVAISSRTTDLTTGKAKSYGFFDPADINAQRGRSGTFSVNGNTLTGKNTSSRSKEYEVVNYRQNAK
jgi:hypothetical protein